MRTSSQKSQARSVSSQQSVGSTTRVAAGEVETEGEEDAEEFFQDVDILQNLGIVSFIFLYVDIPTYFVSKLIDIRCIIP